MLRISRGWWSGIWAITALALAPRASAEAAAPDPNAAYAQRLYQRLTGVPLDDARLAQMTTLVGQGRIQDAAHIATSDPFFYNMTVWDMATGIATVDQTPYVDFNDLMAMIVGVTKDDLDARTLLSGNFHYEGRGSLSLPAPSLSDNEHYKEIGARRVNLKDDLLRVDGQLLQSPDTAGVLTSRQWASQHFNAGTNRRALEHTFQEFLCAPLQNWKDIGLPEYHIRRDIDRAPGGDPANFQNVCRTCHAGMDAMAGAFAQFDYKDGKPVYYGTGNVAAKYNQNGLVYPDGYVTLDDTWINMATEHHNVAFGWRGPTEGSGARELGTMIANAKAYGTCWTKRAFREVCKRAPTSNDDALITALSDQFEAGGYKLRGLFEQVASSEACLGQVGGDVPLALKNFRQLFESLAIVTHVSPTDPDVKQTFEETKARLPKLGQVDEISSPMLLAATSLSGTCCKKMIASDAALPPAQRRAHHGIDFRDASLPFNRAARMNLVQEYANLFWHRAATDDELDSLLDVIGYDSEQRLLGLDERTKVLLMSCTATASSIGSLLF